MGENEGGSHLPVRSICPRFHRHRQAMSARNGWPMKSPRFSITHPRKPARKGEEGTSKTDSSQLLVGPACRLRSSHLALAALARVNWNPRG